MSIQDRRGFIDAQARASRAYEAFNYAAPRPLHGESLRDFRIRLAREMQPHCAAYRNSNLEAIADEAAFSHCESEIYQAALKASTVPPGPGQPLKKVVTHEGGHTITRWYGDPVVANAPFNFGGMVRRGRINRNPTGR